MDARAVGKHALVAHAGVRCDTDVRAGTDAATAADTRGCWLEVERGDTLHRDTAVRRRRDRRERLAMSDGVDDDQARPHARKLDAGIAGGRTRRVVGLLWTFLPWMHVL